MAFDEAAALAYNPWEGDRDSDAVTLRDTFVVTRKPAECAVCFDAIPVGARVRAQTQRSDDERKVMTFKFCASCCEAMAIADDDEGEAIEQRTVIGMERARARWEARQAADAVARSAAK